MKSLKTALQHIQRSPYQAIGAIVVMTLTFFILATFLIVGYGSQVVLNWFETRPQVTAFFKEGITLVQVDDLKDKLQQTGKIKEIKYVSKEDALIIYKDWTKGEPLLQEMVTANLLPASLEISTNNIGSLGEIAEVLKKDATVNEVIFPEDVVSSLSVFTSALRKVGLVMIIFMGIVSMTEVLVIIGMKIALKREEIEILRLIGASSWFIRLPFIIEGIIYGVVGAFMGWLFGYVVLLYSTPFFISYLAEILLFPFPFMIMLAFLGIMIIAGIAVGAVGSFLAVKKYLR